MYLSKRDFDFLVHLRDYFLADRIENRIENIPEIFSVLEEPPTIACYLSDEEFVYFYSMLERLENQRNDLNEKQKVAMREKRAIYGKNYGRGYVATIKKKDCI